MDRRVLITAAIVLAACGHTPEPVAVVNPARGLRSLTADSTEVTAIALAAAGEVRPGAMPKALFAGVYVDGKKAVKASTEVAHANGFALVARPRAPKMTCTLKGPDGQTREMQCPREVVASAPSVYVFDEVRATADSAYVGMSEVTPDATKANCITLLRRMKAWSVEKSTPIGDARQCGK